MGQVLCEVPGGGKAGWPAPLPRTSHNHSLRIRRVRLLYQVISESYERRSIIFTTNIEFSKWGTVFADDKLAQAIVDRVVHHGRLIEYAGPSHRLENSLMLGRGGVVA